MNRLRFPLVGGGGVKTFISSLLVLIVRWAEAVSWNLLSYTVLWGFALEEAQLYLSS